MRIIIHTARISILIAICCSGAFADTHRVLHFSAVEPRESKTSYVQRSDEQKLWNFAPPQLDTFMPGPTDPVASGWLPAEPSGGRKPEVQLIPESNSDNLAPPRPGSRWPELMEPDESSVSTPEPFNLPAIAAQHEDVSTRWAELQSRLLADDKTIAACDALSGSCPEAARRLLSIVELGRKRNGLARLGWINRAINLAIRPMSDWAQYGYAQFWASPLQTLTSGAGDCKDYAIVKYAALRKLGISPADLRLVIVRDNSRQAEHEILAVRYGQKWLILDNLTMAMLDAQEIRNYYPLFVMDYRGAREFTATVARR